MRVRARRLPCEIKPVRRCCGLSQGILRAMPRSPTKQPIDVVALLTPLFYQYRKTIRPASKRALNLFRARAAGHGVPGEVIDELVRFYSVVSEVPCLNSLSIYRCDDLIIFEWWDQQRDLWLGQCDFYILRWSQAKNRFCFGSVDNISFSPSDEYLTFTAAVERMAKLYEVPHLRGPAPIHDGGE